MKCRLQDQPIDGVSCHALTMCQEAEPEQVDTAIETGCSDHSSRGGKVRGRWRARTGSITSLSPWASDRELFLHRHDVSGTVVVVVLLGIAGPAVVRTGRLRVL